MSDASTYMRLEVISGVAPGSTLVVEDELVIGRHATGAGRLAEDEEISRQHARISREATGNYAIEDLGSSNGTFVNGLRIQSPRVLAVGDSIETGATTLVVREIVQRQPETAPEDADTPGSEGRAAPTVFARVPAVEEAAASVQASAQTPPAAAPAEPVQAPTPAASVVEPADTTAPAATPEAPASQIPPPKLKLEIDFDAREARIALGDDGETVRLVFADGAWRAG
ncbi:MAG TPA: FHA domain-containing protein [Solirubrobacteraceae bacterium]|jgi:pSer/pThr/pTyr-binding forkhead associated (FHA) protein